MQGECVFQLSENITMIQITCTGCSFFSYVSSPLFLKAAPFYKLKGDACQATRARALMPLAWASDAAGYLAGRRPVYETAEGRCLLRACPWGGRPCVQGLSASPEQAKPWEPAEKCILHIKMAIFAEPCKSLSLASPQGATSLALLA